MEPDPFILAGGRKCKVNWQPQYDPSSERRKEVLYQMRRAHFQRQQMLLARVGCTPTKRERIMRKIKAQGALE